MKNNKSKKTICLTAVALLLIMSLMVGTAMAYFTTYAVAQGGYSIKLGFSKTEIQETVTDKKEIRIKNTGDYDCYVRLKALVGDKYKDDLRYSEPGGKGRWTPNADGYYYYSDILKPGESTEQIDVTFVLPQDTETFDQFNVIIIQECAKVLYMEDGTPTADWNNIADVSQTIYKEEEEKS